MQKEFQLLYQKKFKLRQNLLFQGFPCGMITVIRLTFKKTHISKFKIFFKSWELVFDITQIK